MRIINSKNCSTFQHCFDGTFVSHMKFRTERVTKIQKIKGNYGNFTVHRMSKDAPNDDNVVLWKKHYLKRNQDAEISIFTRDMNDIQQYVWKRERIKQRK